MAQIPPGYLNSVVSLGEGDGDQFQHRGTGFLYGHYSNDGHAKLYLVTNKHVVQQARLISSVRINVGDGFQILPLGHVVAAGEWATHPSEDVAIIAGNAQSPLMHGKDASKDVFLQTSTTITAEDGALIAEGHGVFVLGFPMGLVGVNRNYTIVRQGVIARIQDWHKRDEKTFLIDASVFPGNSGGPVVLQPEAAALKNTRQMTRAVLIGMISRYIPYRDAAISAQTGEARVEFVENSGLAIVVPIQIIQEFIESTDHQFRK